MAETCPRSGVREVTELNEGAADVISEVEAKGAECSRNLGSRASPARNAMGNVSGEVWKSSWPRFQKPIGKQSKRSGLIRRYMYLAEDRSLSISLQEIHPLRPSEYQFQLEETHLNLRGINWGKKPHSNSRDRARYRLAARGREHAGMQAGSRSLFYNNVCVLSAGA